MAGEQATVKRYQAPAVEGFLKILEYLDEHPKGAGISDLARQCAISKNMVYRIVRLLEEQGYFELDESNTRYRLGRGFLRLAVRTLQRFTLTDRARPHLQWLGRRAEELVSLQILDGEHMLVIDVVTPPLDYYFHMNAGIKLDLHCNAMAKCVLAHMPEEALREMLPMQLPMRTPSTITSRSELLQCLEQVREIGLAFDLEEYTPGICCIAAPVFDLRGAVVAGLGITGMTQRIRGDNRRELEQMVRECATRISTDMGAAVR